jgi:hypothetical protein
MLTFCGLSGEVLLSAARTVSLLECTGGLPLPARAPDCSASFAVVPLPAVLVADVAADVE